MAIGIPIGNENSYMMKKIPIGNKNSYRNSYRIGKWWKKFIAYTTMA
jgi:hypothetical protein